jgi:DNA polymerase III epsilon subunit-like protein
LKEFDMSERVLFYDTETTGLPIWKAGPDHPDQPHIVQLAGMLMEPDRSMAGFVNVIIKPDGFEIPPEASDIHGITQDQAEAEGIPLWRAMWMFERLLGMADLRVAHNVDFDDLLLSAAYHRLGLTRELLNDRPSYCTKEATTPILELPGPYGFKWPKLSEAYEYYFDKEIQGAHDAMVDLKACADIYYAILDDPAWRRAYTPEQK